MKAKRIECFGEDWETRYWYLCSLATLPAYQGRGAATRLVRWGLDQARADADARPELIKGACTVASPAGLATYKKCGIVEVGEVVHDIGKGKLAFLIKGLGTGNGSASS